MLPYCLFQYSIFHVTSFGSLQITRLSIPNPAVSFFCLRQGDQSRGLSSRFFALSHLVDETLLWMTLLRMTFFSMV